MQRYRNPANGYRSNPIGFRIGGGEGGGIVTDGPGYRNYSRGSFGRGQPPPPRRIDVFMEAGKLATEYLASKGLLPPNSLNGKRQNSNLKNQIHGGGVDGTSEAVSGTGGSRRKFPDDYSSATGSRDVIRARRTMGSVKSPAVESIREISRTEKVKRSSDKQGDGDSLSGSMEEKKSGKNSANEDQKSVTDDVESKSYDAGKVETTITNNQNEDEIADTKTLISEVKMEILKNSNSSTDDTDMVMDDGNQESEKPDVKEEPLGENNNEITNNNGSDLLTIIRFNKIPTRRRSSVALKGSISDPVLVIGDDTENKHDDDEDEGSKHESSLKIEQVPSEDDQKYNFEQESRTEKRSLQINDRTESAKKPRNVTSANPQADDYMHNSSSRDEPSSPQGSRSKYPEEKQFFPSSLNICDLNPMKVSRVNNSHDINSVTGVSSAGQAKQEPVSVDFGLTMNTSSNGKQVEVIDLDCDSVQEDHNNSERRDEAIFTDLGSFPDSMQRVSDLPQDGYGLTISELLEAGVPNSSVTTGVNSMHNNMSLRNEEEILGDDDSIYMSLGEIPISFVPVWDHQSSQGYNNKRY